MPIIKGELNHLLKASGILVVAALLGAAPNYSRLKTNIVHGEATQRGGGEQGLEKEYATRNGVMVLMKR